MSKIRIIDVPPGFAPLDIRSQWVGVEIRKPTEAELSVDPPTNLGIGNENEGGYIVFSSDAISALRAAGKTRALNFWKGFAIGRYLRFKKDVCEIVE